MSDAANFEALYRWVISDPRPMPREVSEDVERLYALAGFTWEDIAMLERNHLDLSDDQYADPDLMSFIRRLKALLPPKPSDPALTGERGGLSALSPDEEQHLRDSL